MEGNSRENRRLKNSAPGKGLRAQRPGTLGGPESRQALPWALGGDLQAPGMSCPTKHPGLHEDLGGQEKTSVWEEWALRTAHQVTEGEEDIPHPFRSLVHLCPPRYQRPTLPAPPVSTLYTPDVGLHPNWESGGHGAAGASSGPHQAGPGCRDAVVTPCGLSKDAELPSSHPKEAQTACSLRRQSRGGWG